MAERFASGGTQLDNSNGLNEKHCSIGLCAIEADLKSHFGTFSEAAKSSIKTKATLTQVGALLETIAMFCAAYSWLPTRIRALQNCSIQRGLSHTNTLTPLMLRAEAPAPHWWPVRSLAHKLPY
jgi:hypothetical protein